MRMKTWVAYHKEFRSLDLIDQTVSCLMFSFLQGFLDFGSRWRRDRSLQENSIVRLIPLTHITFQNPFSVVRSKSLFLSPKSYLPQHLSTSNRTPPEWALFSLNKRRLRCTHVPFILTASRQQNITMSGNTDWKELSTHSSSGLTTKASLISKRRKISTGDK